MKKQKNLLQLVIIFLAVVTICSCSKHDARQILKNVEYRVSSIKTNESQSRDLMSKLFPGSEKAGVLFQFENDKIARLYLENSNNVTVTNAYWNQYGYYSYNYDYTKPAYEYKSSAAYAEQFHRFQMNFNIPDNYQNTEIGQILWNMSSSNYHVQKTNGRTRIGPNQSIKIWNDYCTIEFTKK